MQHRETKEKENMKERLRHVANGMRASISYIQLESQGNKREKMKSNIQRNNI